MDMMRNQLIEKFNLQFRSYIDLAIRSIEENQEWSLFAVEYDKKESNSAININVQKACIH